VVFCRDLLQLVSGCLHKDTLFFSKIIIICIQLQKLCKKGGACVLNPLSMQIVVTCYLYAQPEKSNAVFEGACSTLGIGLPPCHLHSYRCNEVIMYVLQFSVRTFRSCFRKPWDNTDFVARNTDTIVS
jgi:hypothetical protein